MSKRDLPTPPPPGEPGYEDPDEAGIGTARMRATAYNLSALGMAYAGLSSFGSNSQLFGRYGDAAANPMQAVLGFVKQARQHYDQMDGTAGAKLKATALREAENNPGRDEAVRNLADEEISRRERISNMSRFMAAKNMETGVEQMAEGVASGEMNARNRARRLATSLAERTDGLTSPDRTRADDLLRNTLANEAGGNYATGDDVSLPSRYNTDAEPRVKLFSPDTDPEVGSSSMTAFDRSPLSGTDTPDLPLAFASATPDSPTLSTFHSKLSGDLHHIRQRAYQRYQASYPLDGNLPSDASGADLRQLERQDPHFRRLMDEEMPDGNGDPVNTKRAVGVRNYERREEIESMPLDAAQATPRFSDPASAAQFQEMNLSAVGSGIEGDDVNDLMAHYREVGTEPLEITEKTVQDMGDNAGVADRLALRAQKKFKWAVEEANAHLGDESGEFKFSMEKVKLSDGQHHIFRGRLSQGGETADTFNLPVVSRKGTYKTPGGRAMTHPMTKLVSNDLFESTQGLEEIRKSRDSNVARPDEMTLMKMGNYAEKFRNDLRSGDPRRAMSFIKEHLIDDSFEQKSLVDSSPASTATSALEVRTSQEMRIQELATNPDRAKQVEQGLESAEQMKTLFNTGHNFYASDSEFVSDDVAREYGSGGAAKTPFEVAGSIINPEEDAAVADINYRMDLSEARKTAGSMGEEMGEQIKDIYQQVAAKDEGEAQTLVDEMKDGGTLEVTVPSDELPSSVESSNQGRTTLDLLGGNQKDIQALEFLPTREQGESLDSYYMRTQNAMLDKFGAQYSVGQNYAQAEGNVYSKLSTDTGVDPHVAVTEQNMIDTMNLAHVFSPNKGTSQALPSIIGATYGVESAQYGQVQDAFERGVRKTRKRIGGGDPVETAANYLNKKPENFDGPNQARREMIGRRARSELSNPSSGQRRLLDDLVAEADQMPDDVTPHTAQFDAYVTGRIALPQLRDYAQTPGGRMARRRAESALKNADQLAGERNQMERYGEMPYFGEGENPEQGPNPFMSAQDAATMGRGVLMDSGMLPFYELQNPVRQLYQRNKPKKLTGQRNVVGGRTAMMSPDGQMQQFPTRARAGGSDNIFTGAASATPTQRNLYGSEDQAAQFYSSARIAQLPNDNAAIYESRGRASESFREAMMPEPKVKSKQVSADFSKQVSGRAQGDSMQNWVKEQAEEVGVDLEARSPQDYFDASRQEQNMMDAYRLAQVHDDKASGVTDTARKLISRGAEAHVRRAKGQGRTRTGMIQEALGKGEEPVVDAGNNTQLFLPDQRKDPIVTDSLLSPKHKRMLGLSASVSRDKDSVEGINLEFIEEPGDTFKTQTMGSKVGNFGVTATDSVGMAGEEAVMEAASMKAKRRDFAGYPRMQIERMHNKAIKELKKIAQEGVGSMERRQDVIRDFVDSVSEMTGMSTGKIRSDLVQETTSKGEKYADFFDINYTKEFGQKVAQNTSTTKMMAAARNMGLSMKHVLTKGSVMLASADMEMNKAEAETKLAGMMSRQVENHIRKVEELPNSEIFKDGSGPVKDSLSGQLDSAGSGPQSEGKKQEVQNLLRELKDQRDELQELHNDTGKRVSDMDLNRGSLWDVFVSKNGNNVSTAFRTLSTSQSMQISDFGGSDLGEDFESRIGRATNRKRSSLLTTAILGQSSTPALGALGDQEQMTQEMFQGWLSSKSGAAMFSDGMFQRKVATALSKNGIDPDKFLDKAKMEERNGTMYYNPDDGETVTLKQWVNDNFEWDSDEGALAFTGGTNKTYLNSINPFETLSETKRLQQQVVGMVTGEMQTDSVAGSQIGGDDRTLTLEFGGSTNIKEGRISAKDFHQLFGRKTRAQQYYQHEEGTTPTPAQKESFDKNYIYFGQDARPGMVSSEDRTVTPGGAVQSDAYKRTIFNENFDFLEVRLHGGLGGGQNQQIVDALRKSGVKEQLIRRSLLGGEAAESAIENVIDADRPEAQRQAKQMVQTLQDRHGSGPAAAYLRTRTRSRAPQAQNVAGGKKASVKQWANLADQIDDIGTNSFEQLQSSVQRIHKLADDIEANRDFGIDDPQGQRLLRETFEQEFASSVNSGAFMDVENFYEETLRTATQGLASQMSELEGRYMGGEYKLADTQVDMIDKFRRLADEMTTGEDMSEGFKAEVENLISRSKNMTVDSDNVEDVGQELRGYMTEQMDAFDGGAREAIRRGKNLNFDQWRGFGVGEGFMAKSKAAPILEKMETRHNAYASDANQISEPTNAKERALQRMQESDAMPNPSEASRRELAIARQEMQRPGSTPGVMMTSVRQPDFTAAGKYEMSQMSILSDESMMALGADPENVHTNSHPLVSWSRKEDFDYDLNYMAAIDDTATAHMVRQTRGQSMGRNLTNLFKMVEGVTREDSIGGMENIGDEPGGGTEITDRFRERTRQVSIDAAQMGDDFQVSDTRVTTPFDAGENIFGDSVGQFFSASGLARDMVADGQSARRDYALQQSIVGQFGAYAKQGAIKTEERSTAFTDIMSRLQRDHERMQEQLAQQDFEGDPKAKTDQIFNNLFKGGLPEPAREGGPGKGWEYMKETYRRGANMRQGDDLLHLAALTETEVTQAVAIEKYKTGDAQEVSRKMNNIMQTLHGNHSGSYKGFDDAFGALMEDDLIGQNLPFDPDQMFEGVGRSDETTRQTAKRAFRQQYDMNRAMKMASAAGIGDDYMSSYANVPNAEVPFEEKLALADEQLRKSTGGTSLLTESPRMAGSEFVESMNVRSQEAAQQMRSFFAAQGYRERKLSDLIDAPATMEEKMATTLQEMPTGRKAVAMAGAAGLAALSLSDSPDVRGGTNDRDLPTGEGRNYRAGHRGTSRNVLAKYERRQVEREFATRRQPTSGRARMRPQRPTQSRNY